MTINETNVARIKFTRQTCIATRREGDLVALISNDGELNDIKKAIVDIKNAATEAKNSWLTWTNGNEEEFETVGIKHGETDAEYTRRITLIHTRENLKYFTAIIERIYGVEKIDLVNLMV